MNKSTGRGIFLKKSGNSESGAPPPIPPLRFQILNKGKQAKGKKMIYMYIYIKQTNKEIKNYQNNKKNVQRLKLWLEL